MKIFLAVIVMLLGLGVCQTAQADTVTLPQYGFQIDPLDAPVPSTSTVAIMTFLPPSNGFSPNVNVMIQPFDKDIKGYSELSKKQFDQLGYKVISQNMVGDSEWAVEYAGSLKDSPLHWYARAILKSGKVYLVTATGSEAEWSKVSGALKKCVESFKIK